MRTGLDPKTNEYVPIIPRPTGFFPISITVLDSMLTITADGVTVPYFDIADVASHLDPSCLRIILRQASILAVVVQCR